MRNVIVEYKVKSDRVEENKKFVEAVFAELKSKSPSGVRYATSILEDGVTFVHIASFDSEANPLGETEAFKQFQADLKDRCEIPPTARAMDVIGNYNLFNF